MTEEKNEITLEEQNSDQPTMPEPGSEVAETSEQIPDESKHTEIVESQTQEVTDDPEPLSNMPEPDEDFEPTMESVIEAILFASDEPVRINRLADIAETSVKQAREHIKNLNAKYKTNNNAFRIEQIAGGLQMLTLNPFNHWLKKLIKVRGDNKLSPAALETLAIIAYKQPVIRADIEAIRGVAAGEMIRNLMYKGLVKIVGRAEILGRPMLYGTTKKFLEIFGLNTLKDLPSIEELKKPQQ